MSFYLLTTYNYRMTTVILSRLSAIEVDIISLQFKTILPKISKIKSNKMSFISV